MIADRSVIFAEGLAAVLASTRAAEVVGRVTSPEDVLSPGAPGRCPVVVACFEPPADSIRLARRHPWAPVLVVTSSTRRADLLDAVRVGARGFLAKDATPDELVDALRRVANGRTSFPDGWERHLVEMIDGGLWGAGPRREREALTPRERDILQLVVDGCSNKEIARLLGIAHQTAKNHLRNVMAKLGVSSRMQLYAWALEHGFETDGSSRFQYAGA